MPWYLYIAIKQLFPSGRFFSLFSFLSIAGVAIGVWMLVVVQSVMNGFGEEIRDNMIDTAGHVQVVSSGSIIYNQKEIIEKVHELPEVEAASPYARGVVMLQHRNRPAFPKVWSIDINNDNPVVKVADYLRMGTLDDIDDESVVLSVGLANMIGAYVGSTVDVYTPLLLDRLKDDEVLLPRELTVVGLFETGYGEIDGDTMLVTLRLMQELYGLDRGVHGVSLRLKDRDQAEQVAAKVESLFEPPIHSLTWWDVNGNLLFILRMEKMVLFFILIVISIVAAFAITISLFTTVLRKTREIGLYGALGGTPMQAAGIFCFQGFIIGLIGTIVGVVSAVSFLPFRNDIVHTFARITKSEAAFVQFYQFVDLPLHYSKMDFIVIILFAIVISTIAGLIPAWRASRLKPSDAMRNE